MWNINDNHDQRLKNKSRQGLNMRWDAEEVKPFSLLDSTSDQGPIYEASVWWVYFCGYLR